MQPKKYTDIALVAPVTVPYVRYSDHGATRFIGTALARMLERVHIDKHQVDGLAVSSFSLQPDGVASLCEHFRMCPRWIETVNLGGASGVVAMRRAARAVQAGDAEIVACIGGDTLQRGGFQNLVANFSRFSVDAVYPYGASGPNGVFAMITRRYMETHDVGREGFGSLCVAQRENASRYPHALFQEPLTIENYLNARPIAEPLHLFDCVMPCAGAEGFLVMSADSARKLDLPYAEILAACERHNAFFEDDIQLRSGWLFDRDPLYEQAGMGPDDMDFVQTYDDYPVIAMMQLEDLGFCDRGAAASLFESDIAASLPHNTCGGQLSVGQAGAAGGYLGLVEGIRQLTGENLGREIENARHGLVSGYGMVNYDRGLCSSATVLRSGQA